jgi:uncharacterized protein (TIGR03067 family)
MFALLLACAMAAADDKAVKEELAKLEGTWQVESFVVVGKDFFADGSQPKFHFVVGKDGEATLDENDFLKKLYEKYTFKVDPSTTPKCVDVTVTAGSQKGVKIEGIYELKGDELRVCAKAGGNERPAELKSPEGTEVVLFVLKRQKK